MKKKILLVIAISLILGLVVFFSYISIFTEKQDDFFAWMDAYIATETEAENSISITLFSSNPTIDMEDVININFIDLEEKVTITSFQINEPTKVNWSLSSQGIVINYNAKNPGIYKTKGVEITYIDGEIIQYMVGNWTFDVNEPMEKLVDTWSSPGAYSSESEFPYNYTVINSNAVIMEISCGENLSINNEKEILSEGKIDIQNDFEAPIVYIKSKIQVSLDGKIYTNSGNGCYCGAMDSTEDFIKASKERNTRKAVL